MTKLRKVLTGNFQQTTSSGIGDLALRVFAGLSMCLAHGMGKIPPSEKFIEGVTSLGFPFPLFFAWNAGLAEALGGLLLALGFFTRPAAATVSLTMMVAAFGRHAEDPFKQKELALLYLAIAVFYVFNGAGKFSLDRWFSKKLK